MEIKYIIIGSIVVLILIIIICNIIKKQMEKNNEKPASILDVDLNGVPSSSDRSFDYGYEKEDTVVMEPIKKETKKTTKKSNKSKQKK